MHSMRYSFHNHALSITEHPTKVKRNLAPFRKVGDTAQARFASTPRTKREPPMALQRSGHGGMPEHELLQQSPLGF